MTRITEAGEGGRSAGSGHPATGRLLAYYHRSLSEEDQGPLLAHLFRCAQCRSHLRRIEATVSQFHSVAAWRSGCIPASDLFLHAGHELPEERAREAQEHVMICFQCREEMLVFKDLRQSARVGRSIFLDPTTFAQSFAYWRTRGFWAWLLQPRWRDQVRRVSWGIVAILVLLGVWKLVAYTLSQDRSSNRSRVTTDDALFRKPTEKPVVVEVKKPEYKLRRASQTLYYYLYDAETVSLVNAGDGISLWAEFHIKNDKADQKAFRIAEPPGNEGMIVLRPVEPLLPDEQARLRGRIEQLLTRAVRSSAQEWSGARAHLQQLTGGAVWLLQPPPQEARSSRYAGPEVGGVKAPGWQGGQPLSPPANAPVQDRASPEWKQ